MSTHTRILFVCLGNICRAPAAENTMRMLLQKHQISSVSLDSAGTAGYHIGKEPDPRMTAALERKGILVTGRARKLDRFDFSKFDLIIAMDDDNYEDVLMLATTEEDRAKVHKFVSFCQNHPIAGVPDPYHGDDKDFDEVVSIAEDGCEGILKSLREH